jgi:glycosyltransferase involved in cell wall biosynthesis
VNQKKYLHVAIDATNISSGGGLTHLKSILQEYEPSSCYVKKITIWTSRNTALHLPQKKWIEISCPSWCNKSTLLRLFGQHCLLPNLALKARCDVIFSPGGTLPFLGVLPTVTMSQNLLPFEGDRAILFGRFSWMRAKMALLRMIQSFSFKKASGIIFLTHYAHRVVMNKVGVLINHTALIPHGVETRFLIEPRSQKQWGTKYVTFSDLKLLYVSAQMPYKHQLEVLEAVSFLRQKGWLIKLQIVGASFGDYGKKITQCIRDLDPEKEFLHDLGQVDFENLHEIYKQADAFIFASSCENLPNILIEAMASGLPTLCSHFGPMPEILGEAGEYFNPEAPQSLVKSIESLASKKERRLQMAWQGYEKAQNYSWVTCAQETFKFIEQVVVFKKVNSSTKCNFD